MGLPAASSTRALSIVLVDDTITFRELLKEALQRRFAPHRLLDFTHGKDGLDACLREDPDLLIVDLYLYDIDGRDLVRALRQHNTRTRVIVLTAHPDARLPAELVALGVAGFVDKHSPLEQIERAVQCVMAGGMFFAASVPPPLPAPGGEHPLPKAGPEILSQREREVARLVMRGLASKEIGAQLGLSPRTVEKHRARMLARLGLHDLPTFIRWSLRNGLG